MADEKKKAETTGHADTADTKSVDGLLFRIGRDKARLQMVLARQDEQVQGVKKMHEVKVRRYTERIAALTGDLEARCEASKTSLMAKARRTLQLTFGKIGWRKKTAAISLQPGVKADTAAARMHQAGFDHLVRTTMALDKAAIKRALADGSISDSDLAAAGVQVTPGFDRFAFEVDGEAVARAAAEQARR